MTVKLKEAKGLGDCLDMEIERGVLRSTCIFLAWATELTEILFPENKDYRNNRFEVKFSFDLFNL